MIKKYIVTDYDDDGYFAISDSIVDRSSKFNIAKGGSYDMYLLYKVLIKISNKTVIRVEHLKYEKIGFRILINKEEIK